MSAMHPESGVPPEDARNSIPNSIEASVNCDELWYSTSRCQPRFDPAAANAMLAELINLINKGEVIYDCTRYDQVQFAVRYLIQRGLCTGTYARGGPLNYICEMDPTLTRYNDYLTIIVVPEANNEGPVQLDTDARGYRNVVRNDGLPLEKGDWLAGSPLLISFWNGMWHMVGLVASQVPCVLAGNLVRWIRTDGDDVDGDGSANTPEKAYRTIERAWAGTVLECASTPGASITMMLGIPGTYAGCRIGPYGGNVYLIGDSGNKAGYKLSSFDIGGAFTSFAPYGIGMLVITGLTFMRDNPSCDGIRMGRSFVMLSDCAFDSTVGGANSGFIAIEETGRLIVAGDCPFYGRGLSIGTLVKTSYVGQFLGGFQATLRFMDCPLVGAAAVAGTLSMQTWQGCTVISSNVTGQQYQAHNNSIIQMMGQPCPGTTPGEVFTGGQFSP